MKEVLFLGGPLDMLRVELEFTPDLLCVPCEESLTLPTGKSDRYTFTRKLEYELIRRNNDKLVYLEVE